jgi:hypothetical protein
MHLFESGSSMPSEGFIIFRFISKISLSSYVFFA